MSLFHHSANSSHPCSNDRLDGTLANEPHRDRSPGLLGPCWPTAVCVPSPGAAPVKAKCSLANLWEAESLRHSQLCFRRQCPRFPTELPATSRPEVRLEARTAVTLLASSTNRTNYMDHFTMCFPFSCVTRTPFHVGACRCLPELSPRQEYLRCLVLSRCQSCWRPLINPSVSTWQPGLQMLAQSLSAYMGEGDVGMSPGVLGTLLAQLLHSL